MGRRQGKASDKISSVACKKCEALKAKLIKLTEYAEVVNHKFWQDGFEWGKAVKKAKKVPRGTSTENEPVPEWWKMVQKRYAP